MKRVVLAVCCAAALGGLPSAHAADRTRTARHVTNEAPPVTAAGSPAAKPIELAPPHATATVVGANPAYVGQMTQVEVALWRDSRADNQVAPFFPELRVHGAIALLAPTAPPPEEREDGGVTFLVQKRHYLLFPQRPGSVQVPSIQVELPAPQGASVAVQTPPLELTAAAVSVNGGAQPLIARNVQVERHVEGDLEGLRVGDALTVSVRVTAEDTHALVLPAHAAPELSGLTRYPEEPRTRTRAVRGQYSAERVDTATYVARDFGRYTLPRLSVGWLDPETGELHEAVAPALSFRARPNPRLGLGCLGGPAAAARATGALGALLLLVALGIYTARRVAARRARRARVARTSGEKAAFAALLEAARAGKDGATLTALYRWLHFAITGVPTLERLREADHDPELAASTEALEGRLCASAMAGSAAAIVRPLKRYRKSSRPAPEGRAQLPELNSRVWRVDSRERSDTSRGSETKQTEE